MNELTVDQAREVVQTERAARMVLLKAVVDRNPNGKLAKKAEGLWLDYRILEDKIAEAGGEDGLAFIICTELASGVPLWKWSEDHAIPRGMVWAFMTATEARRGQFYAALHGVADWYVEQAKDIADTVQIGERRKVGKDGEEEVTYEDMLGHRKFRVATNLKLAALFHPERFAEKQQLQISGRISLDAVLESMERVIEGEVVG